VQRKSWEVYMVDTTSQQKNKQEIEELFDLYDVPNEHRKDANLNINYCPKCKTIGRWRSGADFDHMRICSKCWSVWTPSSIKSYRAYIADELQNVDGEGI
jgi:hypothetical protein